MSFFKPRFARFASLEPLQSLRLALFLPLPGFRVAESVIKGFDQGALASGEVRGYPNSLSFSKVLPERPAILCHGLNVGDAIFAL